MRTQKRGGAGSLGKAETSISEAQRPGMTKLYDFILEKRVTGLGPSAGKQVLLLHCVWGWRSPLEPSCQVADVVAARIRIVFLSCGLAYKCCESCCS